MGEKGSVAIKLDAEQVETLAQYTVGLSRSLEQTVENIQTQVVYLKDPDNVGTGAGLDAFHESCDKIAETMQEIKLKAETAEKAMTRLAEMYVEHFKLGSSMLSDKRAAFTQAKAKTVQVGK